MWPLESVRSQQASMQGSTKDGCARQEEEEEEEEEDVCGMKKHKEMLYHCSRSSFFANCIS